MELHPYQARLILAKVNMERKGRSVTTNIYTDKKKQFQEEITI